MKKKLIAFIIIGAIGSSCFLGDSSAYAVSKKDNENKIEENKDKIDNLKKEKDKVNENKEKKNDELNKVLGEIDKQGKIVSDSENVVLGYQKKVSELNGEIDSINNKIKDIENSVKTKEEAIEKNQKKKEENQKILDSRLREYYKTNMGTSMLSAVLNSDGFSDLISNIYTMNKIIDIDNKLIKESKELDKKLQEEKVELDREKSLKDSEKAKISEKKNEQESLKKKAEEERDKQKAELSKLEKLEDDKKAVLDNMSKKESSIKDEINDLESYNKELQNQIDKLFEELNNKNNSNNNKGNSSNNSDHSNSGSKEEHVSGKYIRPTSGPVTSPYGPRVHPIKGQVGFHTGVDLGAPNGAPIKAAANGTVVLAGWVSGYGKTVIIDHGNGEQTLYAHTSAYNVTEGQSVKQGQVIANVGSTGNSTGPHLHWEVRKNGQHVSPMGYV